MPTASLDASVCRMHSQGLKTCCWSSLLPHTSLCSGTAAALCCRTCRFATAYEGKYSDSIQQAYVYPSTNYLDDLAWGATWLYQLTNESQFLTVSSLFKMHVGSV